MVAVTDVLNAVWLQSSLTNLIVKMGAMLLLGFVDSKSAMDETVFQYIHNKVEQLCSTGQNILNGMWKSVSRF